MDRITINGILVRGKFKRRTTPLPEIIFIAPDRCAILPTYVRFI